MGEEMRTMKIKNYTTSISASRTMMEIEEMLVSFGATAIQKKYRGDGRVEALAFQYQGRGYLLPSNTEKCEQALFKRHSQSSEEQAEKVAWRVIKDWLHAQLSLITIGQAEVEQVMLPYMWNGKETLYDKLKERQFLLPENSGSG